VLVAGLALIWLWERYEERAALGSLEPHEALCIHVIDGDTIDVRTAAGEVRVRLLGMDCPETHNFDKQGRQARALGVDQGVLGRIGREATAFTRRSLEREKVTLVYPGDEMPLDDYDRALCYVEVGGLDHGEELLAEGLATPRREPHPRKRTYERVAAEAKKRGVGLYR
jgi:endonuclease YncB( thermonuclease family)